MGYAARYPRCSRGARRLGDAIAIAPRAASADRDRPRPCTGAALRGRVAAIFQDIDLLLVPAQGVAPLTTAQVSRLGEDATMLQALLRFTCPFDMTGSPTITLPCGFTDAGAPIGFQFVGRHLEEDMLVRAGYAYQSATDWHRRHPALPGD